MLNRLPLLLPTVGVLLLAGCREPKIRSYTIAKETTPPPSAAKPATSASSSSLPTLVWEKPAAWQEQTGRTMRVASFLVAEANGTVTELAVTTFPGDVGGDFANVNRWRGQIGLPPIAESDLAAAISTHEFPAGKFQLIDITGTEPVFDGKHKARILGAWLKQPERTWFFKMTGDEATVGGQRDNLFAFLRTVAFKEPSAPAHDHAHDHAEHSDPHKPAATAPTPAAPASDMLSQPVPTPPPSSNPIVWTAPADWKIKSLGQMRKGSYTVPGTAGDADLSVTMLSARANPLLENINRWRRQIGLPPLAEADLPAQTETVAAGDLKITAMDYANAGNRVLGGILYLGDEAWFFKLSGPDATVAAQKSAFLEFLKSVKAR